MISFYHPFLNSATYQSLDTKVHLISKCLDENFEFCPGPLGQKYFVRFLQELKKTKTNRHYDPNISCRASVKFLNPGQGDAVLINYPDFRTNLTISFINFPISGLSWHSQQFVTFLDDCDFQITCSRHRNLQNIRILIVKLSKKFRLKFWFFAALLPYYTNFRLPVR